MPVTTNSTVTITPSKALRGRIRVPGDKSISHRYAILAALASGTSSIGNYSQGEDCRSTLRCLRALGVDINETIGKDSMPNAVAITGRGLKGFNKPSGPLDAGNSGTTLRLLSGVVSASPFRTVITGDHSLRTRPMRRVIEPLQLMGATFNSIDGCPPLTIEGGPLGGIDYSLPIASAQVKSAILLAGLHANGVTSITEPSNTRDHTERALEKFGANFHQGANGQMSVIGNTELSHTNARVPGDLSSAAFLVVAALMIPGSDVEIESVGLNPSRTAYLEVLRRAGANIETELTETDTGEPFGTIRIRYRRLQPIVISPREVPGLIDELPVLGALAAHAGSVEVSGAEELRNKESDRIAHLTEGFRRMGARVDERIDGFRIAADKPLPGGTVDAAGDHRLAMAFAVAALGGNGPSVISGSDTVDISYPGFFSALNSLQS